MIDALNELWAAIPLGLRVFYGFVFGVLNGWFSGVVIERVPKGIGISGLGDSPRSMCVCGRELPLRESIPVIGYLRLRGRAKCCGAKIPAWYLAAELGMGAWWAAAWASPRVWLAALLSVLGFAGLVAGGLARRRR